LSGSTGVGRGRFPGRDRQDQATLVKAGFALQTGEEIQGMTHLNHSLLVAENLLNQNFTPARPGQVWVTDISVPQQAA